MEIIIYLIITIIAMILIGFSSTSKLDYSVYEDVSDTPYKDKEEEMFYHPVTGYKGNKANMDAYIQNREKELERKLK